MCLVLEKIKKKPSYKLAEGTRHLYKTLSLLWAAAAEETVELTLHQELQEVYWYNQI